MYTIMQAALIAWSPSMISAYAYILRFLLPGLPAGLGVVALGSSLRGLFRDEFLGVIPPPTAGDERDFASIIVVDV